MTGYRITPIFAKAPVGDTNTNRRLASFVFVDAYQSSDFLHVGQGKTCINNILSALVLLHVPRQNGVKHLIRRQTVLVGLFGPQLSAGWAGDDALWYWG